MAHGSLADGMASRDLTVCIIFMSTLLFSAIDETEQHHQEPEFLAPLENHTVTQGRDVAFTCVVNHLQSYKVAWLKSDSRTILAMHTHMVQANPRLSVTHNGHNAWKLHVCNVQPTDSGTYMCQVNTEPMRSQVGHMKVVIPPDIIDEGTEHSSSTEHGEVKLNCRATGEPKPDITWRREDGRNIILRNDRLNSIEIKTYKGEELKLTGILRQEMGTYLCIASNGVPPTVSKRYYVNVLFKPTVKVKDRVITTSINSVVTLKCIVESSPKSLTIWNRENGSRVMVDDRHSIIEFRLNDYSHQISLIIHRIQSADFGTYFCISENSFGKSKAFVRLKDESLSRGLSRFIHRKNSSYKNIYDISHNFFNGDAPKESSPRPKYEIILDEWDRNDTEGFDDTYYDSIDILRSRYLNCCVDKIDIHATIVRYIIVLVIVFR